MTHAALLPQFSRFLQVGLLCTGIQYLCLVIGVEGLGAGAVPASAAGYLASATASYLLNRHYTFAHRAAHSQLAWRFVAVLAAGLLLNTLSMQLLHGYLRWQYVMAQLTATAAVLLWNFSAHRYWTFSRSKTCG